MRVETQAPRIVPGTLYALLAAGCVAGAVFGYEPGTHSPGFWVSAFLGVAAVGCGAASAAEFGGRRASLAHGVPGLLVYGSLIGFAVIVKIVTYLHGEPLVDWNALRSPGLWIVGLLLLLPAIVLQRRHSRPM
jgi:hypothetical protein